MGSISGDVNRFIQRLTNNHEEESILDSNIEQTSKNRTKGEYITFDANAVCDQDVSALVKLPPELLDEILGNLSYAEIAKIRPICQKLNVRAMQRLNDGFEKLGRLLEHYKAEIKTILPKRESDRRHHRLFKVAEVLSSMETRRGLLDMTFGKYIRQQRICFIPGLLLDEGHLLVRIMKQYITSDEYLTKDSAALLREFRDLSSMATEHFEDVIEPKLKTKNVPKGSPTTEMYDYALYHKIRDRLAASPSTTAADSPITTPCTCIQRARGSQQQMEQRVKALEAKNTELEKRVEQLSMVVGQLTGDDKSKEDSVEIPKSSETKRKLTRSEICEAKKMRSE